MNGRMDNEEGKTLRGLLPLIRSKRAKIGVFGSGHVGLPLACAFAEAGFQTIACDSDQRKVAAIQNWNAYVEDDYVKRILPRLVKSKTLAAKSDVGMVASLADFAIIAVPTPLDDSGEPDLSYVTSVARDIAKENRLGKFIILESSVYPGATKDVVRPILEKGGLRAGVDFGLAHSPERIDYGNSRYSFRDTPKIVGGINKLCTQVACELYGTIVSVPIVPVSGTEVAEATKMLENTYRFVNIAMVNELAILHERLGIDFFEVIAAASTKPFGFQAFYPGPGVGGHCIPKDPHYLSYRARQVGLSLNLVETSQSINQSMVDHILSRLENRLGYKGRTLLGAKATILGLAFKPDVSDTRNSPSIGLAEELERRGAKISVYDPYVASVLIGTRVLVSADGLDSAVRGADLLFLMTPHSVFRTIDLVRLCALANRHSVIVDTRGFWTPGQCRSAGFDYLGLGRPEPFAEENREAK